MKHNYIYDFYIWSNKSQWWMHAILPGILVIVLFWFWRRD